MRNFGSWCLLAAGSLALALRAGGVSAQNTQAPLPIGAGAIGKGPDALTPPGYEDVPRPPAFTAETRAEVAEQEKAVDNYTPQPAWAGQTRAPKPARLAAYEVETAAEGLFSPWSFSFLPDGRILVSETSRGLLIVDKNGRRGEYISGLPVDFSKRAQQLLDSIPDKDFAQNRVIYGFPVISYGREYTGELINGGLTAKQGLEQPIYFWTPSVAPSGMTFYTGSLFPEWRGDLFIATMSPRFGRKVIRLVLKETPEGMRVAGEEFLLAELGGTRFRDVKQGPDGALYVLTDVRPSSPTGPDKILRLVPRKR